VRFGGGESATEHDPFAAPFGNGSAIFFSAHMAPDLRAGPTPLKPTRWPKAKGSKAIGFDRVAE